MAAHFHCPPSSLITMRIFTALFAKVFLKARMDYDTGESLEFSGGIRIN